LKSRKLTIVKSKLIYMFTFDSITWTKASKHKGFWIKPFTRNAYCHTLQFKQKNLLRKFRKKCQLFQCRGFPFAGSFFVYKVYKSKYFVIFVFNNHDVKSVQFLNNLNGYNIKI
jgi:hypothetical protein